MSELTREYLDKKLNKLATKDDLKKLEVNLKSHTENEIAELAGMVSRRFDEVEKKLDIRAEVDQLQVKMNKVWEALNIKY